MRPFRSVPAAAAALLMASAFAAPGAAVAADAHPAAPAAAAQPPSACGDHLLAADESCESCPADCQATACAATGRRTVSVDLAPQSGYESVGAVSVLLAYRQNALGLPGGADAALKSRVKARQADAQLFANDLGYALRVVVSSQAGLQAGPLFDVDFDTCAATPAAADLSCRVESCAQGGGRLNHCECAARLP